MSLLDEARAQEKRAGGICRVRRLNLPEDLAREIHEAVDDGVQLAALERALKARKIDLRYDILARHFRDKGCKCWDSNGQPV